MQTLALCANICKYKIKNPPSCLRVGSLETPNSFLLGCRIKITPGGNYSTQEEQFASVAFGGGRVASSLYGRIKRKRQSATWASKKEAHQLQIENSTVACRCQRICLFGFVMDTLVMASHLTGQNSTKVMLNVTLAKHPLSR